MQALRLLALLCLGLVLGSSCASAPVDQSERAVVARIHLLFDT